MQERQEQQPLGQGRKTSAGPRPSILAEVPGLVSLAVPVVIGLLGATVPSAIDSYMLGPLGEVPLAAASLTQSVLVIFYAGLYGLVGAVGLLTGKAHGAGDAAGVGAVLRHGLVIGAAGGFAGTLVMAGVYLALPYVGQPREVLAALPAYWLTMSALLVPFTLMIVIKQLLDAVGRPWTAAVLSLVPVPVVVTLNWLLVYGNLGFPRLGLLGAGIASLCAFAVGFATMFAYIRLAPAMQRYRVPTTLGRTGFAEQTREGVPMSIQYLAEGTSVAVAGILIGLLGATTLAANQIVFSVGAVVYMAPLGMAAAVSIRIAQAFGERALGRIRPIGLAGIGIVTLWMIAFTLVMVNLGGAIAATFVDEGEVISAAAAMFVAVGLMQVFDGLQSVALGALRGMLDNRWPTRVSLLAYWLIALPLSVLGGFVLNLGGAGVWAGFGCGLAFAGVALLWRFLDRTAALVSHHRREESE